MNTPEMIEKTRTLLDENQAGFWSNEEILTALNEGQLQIVSLLTAIYDAKKKIDSSIEVPEALNGLLNEYIGSVSLGQYTSVLPDNFNYDIAVKYTPDTINISPMPIYRRKNQPNLYHFQDNPYLAGKAILLDSIQTIFLPYYNIINNTSVSIKFEHTSSVNQGQYTLLYIKNPSTLTLLVNSELSTITHEGIVLYAVYNLLIKDNLIQESAYVKSQFDSVIQQWSY